MRIVILGDTHGDHRKVELPEGDLLIHVGDFVEGVSNPNAKRDVVDFVKWADDFDKIICVGGNHDGFLKDADGRALINQGKVEYLEDSGTEYKGLKMWGSPWMNVCYGMFNLEEPQQNKKFAMISEGLDILITHSPPHKILDLSSRGDNVGSESLDRHVRRVKPRLHVFGHCHHSGGQTEKMGDTLYANVAVRNWDMDRLPLVFDEQLRKTT